MVLSKSMRVVDQETRNQVCALFRLVRCITLPGAVQHKRPAAAFGSQQGCGAGVPCVRDRFPLKTARARVRTATSMCLLKTGKVVERRSTLHAEFHHCCWCLCFDLEQARAFDDI